MLALFHFVWKHFNITWHSIGVIKFEISKMKISIVDTSIQFLSIVLGFNRINYSDNIEYRYYCAPAYIWMPFIYRKMRKIDFTTLMMLCNVVASLGHWQTAAALGIQTDACI